MNKSEKPSKEAKNRIEVIPLNQPESTSQRL
jgi:hypothetical protein